MVGSAEVLGHGIHLAEHHGGGNAEDRLLPGGVDGKHNDFVERLEDTGEIVGEVAGASVEMGLEDAHDTLAWIEETDGLDGPFNFLRMVSVVVDVDESFLTDAVVEATAHTGKGLEAMTQLKLIEATCESHSGGSDGILNIDEGSTIEFEVIEHPIGGTEVEEEVAVVVADIDGIVVGFDATGGIGER